MSKKNGLFIVLLFCISALHSQLLVKKHIKKGRRNKSEHQLTINKNVFEADWEFGNETISDTLATFVYPNFVFRYGLTDNLEVNLEINPITTYQKIARTKNTISGFEPVYFGARYALTDETKYLPEMALSFQIAPPSFATKNYQANYWAPFIQYTMQKNLNRHFVVAASGGMFYDGFTTTPNWVYDFSPSYNITTRLSVGADVFGFAASQQMPLNNFDLSTSYQFSDHFTIGLTGGTGLSSMAHKSYFAVNGLVAFGKK